MILANQVLYYFKKYICPTVTKFICKTRKNAQNRFVFQNRYHVSEAIRKILIPSDKCSVDVSDSGVHLSGRIKKRNPFVRYYPKNWMPLDKWDSHSKVASTVNHQHLSAVRKKVMYMPKRLRLSTSPHSVYRGKNHR